MKPIVKSFPFRADEALDGLVEINLDYKTWEFFTTGLRIVTSGAYYHIMKDDALSNHAGWRLRYDA